MKEGSKSKTLIFVMLVFLVVLILAVLLLRSLPGRIVQKRADDFREQLVAAAVEFYATDGRYPETYDELIERTSLDPDSFYVSYVYCAANIMPEIHVVLLPESNVIEQGRSVFTETVS